MVKNLSLGGGAHLHVGGERHVDEVELGLDALVDQLPPARHCAQQLHLVDLPFGLLLPVVPEALVHPQAATG